MQNDSITQSRNIVGTSIICRVTAADRRRNRSGFGVAGLRRNSIQRKTPAELIRVMSTRSIASKEAMARRIPANDVRSEISPCRRTTAPCGILTISQNARS
jgi:hypothetical protein